MLKVHKKNRFEILFIIKDFLIDNIYLYNFKGDKNKFEFRVFRIIKVKFYRNSTVFHF